MTFRRGLIALAVAQLCWPAAARAAAFGAVGMVETIRGSASDDEVKVERRGEGRRVIGVHDPLYNGDRLVIRGAATACVNVDGARTCWTSRSPDTTIMSRGAGAASILDAAFFRALGLGPPAAGMGIVTGTVLRSADPVASAGPVTAIGLLPAGPQFMTPTTRRLVAAWRGPARRVIVAPQTGEAIELPATAAHFAEVAVTPGTAALAIRMEPSDIAWAVSVLPVAPAPPWYRGRQPATPRERLARATWLVVDGPPAWRMFAFGELAELSDAGVADAPELYRAALEGRVQHLKRSAP